VDDRTNEQIMLDALKNMIAKHEEKINENGDFIGLFKKPSKINGHKWHKRIKEIIQLVEGGK
jgi:hypothetical protein